MPTASVLRRLVLVTALMGLMGLASTIESSQGKKKADAPQAGSSFEIYKDKGGKFRFRLRDSDDKLLANSGKGYKDNAEITKVVEAIKKNATKAKIVEDEKDEPKAFHFQIYKDKGGKYRFRFKNDEGVLMAASVTGYKTKMEMQNLIEAIQKTAAAAKVLAAK